MSVHWTPIEEVGQLTEVLDDAIEQGGGPILILKHSNRCAISSMAKRRLESKANAGITYYVIDVVRDRSISHKLAELSGIQHESPQVFLYHSGSLQGHWSHMDIRPDVIDSQVGGFTQN